jgi:hypothetical protein
MPHKFTIHKKEDSFKNTKAYREYWDSATDGTYLIEIKKLSKRTLQQNAWIHAVLPMIREALNDAGYSEVKTNADAKMVIKALFFKKTISNGVNEIEIIEGTSEQDKTDFASKAEDIIIWARDYLGIDIAPPGKPIMMFE